MDNTFHVIHILHWHIITVVELTTFFETNSSPSKQLFPFQTVSLLFGRCYSTAGPTHPTLRSTPFFDCGVVSAASFMEASLTSRSNHNISLEFMEKKGLIVGFFKRFVHDVKNGKKAGENLFQRSR